MLSKPPKYWIKDLNLCMVMNCCFLKSTEIRIILNLLHKKHLLRNTLLVGNREWDWLCFHLINNMDHFGNNLSLFDYLSLTFLSSMEYLNIPDPTKNGFNIHIRKNLCLSSTQPMYHTMLFALFKWNSMKSHFVQWMIEQKNLLGCLRLALSKQLFIHRIECEICKDPWLLNWVETKTEWFSCYSNTN